MATLSVPSRPERHPPRSNAGDPQGHQQPVARRLERRRHHRRTGRTRPSRKGLRRQRPETRRMAGAKRLGKPCCLLAARGASSAHANHQPDRKSHSAGAQAANLESSGLSERESPRTSGDRYPPQNRRRMDRGRQNLHHHGQPGCVRPLRPNLHNRLQNQLFDRRMVVDLPEYRQNMNANHYPGLSLEAAGPSGGIYAPWFRKASISACNASGVCRRLG